MKHKMEVNVNEVIMLTTQSLNTIQENNKCVIQYNVNTNIEMYYCVLVFPTYFMLRNCFTW